MSSDSDNDSVASLPSVNQRLGMLRPSKELLDFYRRKIAQFDSEHEQMLAKLEKYKCTYEEQHKLQWELRQREEEIAELQKALSDMQVFLFQERENVLRLYAENDRLKLRELEDRKKIQHLLSLSRPTDSEITYFIRQGPTMHGKENVKSSKTSAVVSGRGPGGHKPVFTKQSDNASVKERKKGGIKEQYGFSQVDNETLHLQIETLQAQIEEQTKAAQEQIEALQEDRRVRMEEQNAQRTRDSDKIKALTDHLNKTQTLLYESTKDYLELKYESRRKERKWMAERDQIIQELDCLKEKLDASVPEESKMLVHSTGTQAHLVDKSMAPEPIPFDLRPTNTEVIKSLQVNLEQSQKLAEMYREQVIGLEDELSRIREESDLGRDMFKERTTKMAKRLTLMNKRYQALESRRTLEVEGFKNDIKMLRARLKDVEKQLFKVTINLGDEFDLEMLADVKQTAYRSKKVVGELHTLKAKVYSLENDLRKL